MPPGSKRTGPSYDRPPVVETVIGVQFPELVGFRAAHFGAYWETIRDRFPKAEDKGRLPEVSESFAPGRAVPSGGMQLLGPGTPERTWFIGETGIHLIQLQSNRFLFNWRAGTDTSVRYPTFPSNSKKFFGEFEAFCRFCEKEKLENPAPECCEVTYVNHIIPQKGESAIDLFGSVFTGLRWELADNWLPAPEAAVFNRRYVIGDNHGRLYAEAGLAVRAVEKQAEQFIRLNVTARVNHDADRDLRDSILLAHDWVVNGFASLTDPGIQDERWGRKR